MLHNKDYKSEPLTNQTVMTIEEDMERCLMDQLYQLYAWKLCVTCRVHRFDKNYVTNRDHLFICEPCRAEQKALREKRATLLERTDI